MTMIWTGRYNYSGPDRVDVTTRKTHPIGKWFAPDWNTTVAPYRNSLKGPNDEAIYTKQYKDHMRTVFATHPETFRWILTQLEVTLVCFCRVDAFCHRFILAKEILTKNTLASVLSVPQAIYKGERGPYGKQTKLF